MIVMLGCSIEVVRGKVCTCTVKCCTVLYLCWFEVVNMGEFEPFFFKCTSE